MASGLVKATALLLLVGYCSAGPACDINGLMPCLTPVMVYSQSPEAQQVQRLMEIDKADDLTEPQIKAICK